jgi:hypothetical protein
MGCQLRWTHGFSSLSIGAMFRKLKVMMFSFGGSPNVTSGHLQSPSPFHYAEGSASLAASKIHQHIRACQSRLTHGFSSLSIGAMFRKLKVMMFSFGGSPMSRVGLIQSLFPFLYAEGSESLATSKIHQHIRACQSRLTHGFSSLSIGAMFRKLKVMMFSFGGSPHVTSGHLSKSISFPSRFKV